MSNNDKLEERSNHGITARKNVKVPMGRVIIALRLCSKIEDAATKEALELNGDGELNTETIYIDDLIPKYVDALRNPYKGASRRLIEPCTKSISPNENYYPGHETFDLAALILESFIIEARYG